MLTERLLVGTGATVVYVTLQKTAMDVAAALVAAGIDARPYHAGLGPLQREVGDSSLAPSSDYFMSPSERAVVNVARTTHLFFDVVRCCFRFQIVWSEVMLALSARTFVAVGYAVESSGFCFFRIRPVCGVA